MRVLISGGGLAGMTLAYWLQRYGVEPVVIEQADDLRRDGYAIDFFGAGYDVAARMGLIEELSAASIRLDGISYVDRDGRVVASLDKALLERVTAGKYLGLMHATLEEALYNAIAGKVEIRFGQSLTSARSRDAGVDVTYASGTDETYDLLIGADGVHSRTRELAFLPEVRFRRYLGYMVACYPLSDHYGIGHQWLMYHEPGRMVGVYPGQREGSLISFLMYHTPEPERLSPDQRPQRLREAFDGMSWITQDVVAQAPEGERIYLDGVSQIEAPEWSRGRVCLVGDACGCPTLISGQGASLALGGAYMLALALRDAPDWHDAFRRYEAHMRPNVQNCQRRARSMAGSFAPLTRGGVAASRLFLRAVLRPAFTGLLRREFSAESFLPATTG